MNIKSAKHLLDLCNNPSTVTYGLDYPDYGVNADKNKCTADCYYIYMYVKDVHCYYMSSCALVVKPCLYNLHESLCAARYVLHLQLFYGDFNFTKQVIDVNNFL